MENPQTVYTFWHYIGIFSFLLFFLGLWIGKRWGIKKGKEQLWKVIQKRLEIDKILRNKPIATQEILTQGVLLCRMPPYFWDLEDGLSIGIEFIPDTKQ